jgi:hypothetical protein
MAVLVLGSGAVRAGAERVASGSLFVESEPAGASVYVDGRREGETPLTLATISVGTHRVRVVRLGYLENSRLITIKPGARAIVRARLTDPAPQAAQTAALKIVVLEGEGAVNIIQQKTAVAPVIEGRDRNDQPVAGAVVKFAIQKGKASFDGARTLSITTNAAGRATATGLTATAKGTLQIAASAVFQGQTAAATIAQTTVMTAAEASSIATGASAASAGSGLSHTTLASIVGAAGAGVAATALVLKGSTVNGVYSGPFDGQMLLTSMTTLFTGGTSTCIFRNSITGTLTIALQEIANGALTGTAQTSGTRTQEAVAISGNCFTSNSSTTPFIWNASVSGTIGNMTFTATTNSATTDAGTTPPAQLDITQTLTFFGEQTGATVSGTMTFSFLLRGFSNSGAPDRLLVGTNVASGSVAFPVTLVR